MTEDLKRKTLFFIALGAILLILLAAALPHLELQHGIPLPRQDSQGAPPDPQAQPPVTFSINTFFLEAMAIIAILTLLMTAYRVLRGTNLKELLAHILAIVLGTLVILGLISLLINVHINVNPALPEVLPTEIPTPNQPISPPTFDFTWLAAIVLALGVVGLGGWLAFRQKQPTPSLLVLQREAERAVQDILAGLDLRSVIIECYLQLSRALQKERDILLEETMTAREFEALLNQRGFPPAPVSQLTRLFENARYSSLPPSAGDEHVALSCLNEIVAFCRLTQKPGAK